MSSQEGSSESSGQEQASDDGYLDSSLWASYAIGYLAVWFGGNCASCMFHWNFSMKGYNLVARLVFVPFLVFAVAPVIGAFGPTLWGVALWCWVLWRLAKAAATAPARLAKKARDRRRQAAVGYLANNFSVYSQRRWRRRGWLVMLRARHEAFLAQQLQGPHRWSCRRKRRDPFALLTPVTTDGPPTTAGGGVPSVVTHGVTVVELCEEGNSDQAIAQAVVTVVRLVEAGLFREILSYL